MITLAISYRAIGKKVRAVSLPRLPWKFFYVMGLALIGCMLIWYVASVNQLTRGAYAIKEYNQQIAQLMAESAGLETNFAQTGFLGNVQQQVKMLGFEKTAAIKYVKINDQSLAQANTIVVK